MGCKVCFKTGTVLWFLCLHHGASLMMLDLKIIEFCICNLARGYSCNERFECLDLDINGLTMSLFVTYNERRL